MWADGCSFDTTNMFVHANGHLPHWSTPVVSGTRFSVILYSLRGGLGGASHTSQAVELERRRSWVPLGTQNQLWGTV